MIETYIAIIRLLRAIHARSQDGMDADRVGADGFAQGAIGDYIARDVRELERLWPHDLERGGLSEVREAARPGTYESFQRIIVELLPQLEDRLDGYFAGRATGDLSVSILDFLDPHIVASSYDSYRAGRYRDAVLNAVVAIFDQIRARTGIDKDGVALVGEAFSLEQPKLVFTTLADESGRNDQKGFMQILQGTYVGVRNPKAHSLGSDLDQSKAGQYLAFLSILARRIAEARVPAPPATR